MFEAIYISPSYKQAVNFIYELAINLKKRGIRGFDIDRRNIQLKDEQLAELILRLDVDFTKINAKQLWEYMQKKDKYLKPEVSTHD